jgi:ATP-dependent DNA ligase
MLSFKTKPMLAAKTPTIPEGDWYYEPKLDGFRCLAFKSQNEVNLRSKTGKSLTAAFREIAGEVAKIKGDFVLDGEIMPESLNFNDLQGRIGSTSIRRTKTAVYFVYDFLFLNGESLISRPYVERRKKLERLSRIFPSKVLLNVNSQDRAVAESWITLPGLDGVMAKRPDSSYSPGSRGWLKYKPVDTADCVLAGVRLNRQGNISQMLLGLYNNGKLHYVGKAPIQNPLSSQITPLLQPFFGKGGFTGKAPDKYVPVEPRVVVEVLHGQIMNKRFRFDTQFKRVRPDAAPPECTFEQLG